MSVDLVRIVDSIHRDKNISKDIQFEGIQSALATAAKKHYPDAAEILVNIDPDSGQIEATKDGAHVGPSTPRTPGPTTTSCSRSSTCR